MEGFDKIDKIYVSATGEQLSKKADVSYYRQIDTVSIPISPPVRGGDDKIHKGFVEAIESLTFVHYEKENEGYTYRLKHDSEHNTFSLGQVGQIYTINTNKESA